jgi:hypothetical protein
MGPRPCKVMQSGAVWYHCLQVALPIFAQQFQLAYPVCLIHQDLNFTSMPLKVIHRLLEWDIM